MKSGLPLSMLARAQRGFLLLLLLGLGIHLCSRGFSQTPPGKEETGRKPPSLEQMQKELEKLQGEFHQMKQGYEKRISALESQLKAKEEEAQLEKEAQGALAPVSGSAKEAPPPAPSPHYLPGAFSTPAQPKSRGLLNYMDVSLNGMFTAGTSTASEAEIQKLEHDDHDPHQRGVNVRNVELYLTGAVDPYFHAAANIVYKLNVQGESEVELEEAYLTSDTLPYGLQLKAGSYFTEFGRINEMHPHTWDFVDRDVINTRLFGPEGLRGPGARLSWLTPLPWYSNLIVGAQNPRGDIAYSFLNEGDPYLLGYPVVNRTPQSLGDYLYSTRWLNSVDITDATTVNVGVSGVFGPNATGSTNRTSIYGADLFLKWQPLDNYNGYPYVTWQSEIMKRDFQAGPMKTDLKDWGFYSQVAYGFHKGWVAALRYDYADGNGAHLDFLRDRRMRLSPNISWWMSEFSMFRLQYNYDWAEHLSIFNRGGSESSLWLEFQFLIGAHPAHQF